MHSIPGQAHKPLHGATAPGRAGSFEGSPQRVGLESLARTRDIVRELREAGQNRDLMAVVMSRLEWEEFQEDDRFRESVRQMKRGERA